jgi:hypothetical protein
VRAERSKAAAAWLNSNAPQAPQFFFSTSLCTVLPISIKRRQTFSRNEITLSTSASLGSLSSGSPGVAPDGLGTPGTGSPRIIVARVQDIELATVSQLIDDLVKP